jgi:hypothetical protein
VQRRFAEALADKQAPPLVYNDLKREHVLRTASVIFQWEVVASCYEAGLRTVCT